ncbi:hypothetical protein [Roseovarius spongiae]|uniref:hypothetical protein n=1 Tax=Roseovarius spongiae TaxID=2320272 RepID=UPI00140A1B52|nr:hypothetical protein [Roseovarius spongiae]
MPTPTYVVLETNPIIAADLCGTIESCGHCRVVHVTDIRALGSALQDISQVRVAYLELKRPELEQSGIGALLRDRGAHIVLTIGEADGDATRHPKVSVLPRPFTEQMILQSLAEVSAD